MVSKWTKSGGNRILSNGLLFLGENGSLMVILPITNLKDGDGESVVYDDDSGKVVKTLKFRGGETSDEKSNE